MNCLILITLNYISRFRAGGQPTRRVRRLRQVGFSSWGWQLWWCSSAILLFLAPVIRGICCMPKIQIHHRPALTNPLLLTVMGCPKSFNFYFVLICRVGWSSPPSSQSFVFVITTRRGNQIYTTHMTEATWSAWRYVRLEMDFTDWLLLGTTTGGRLKFLTIRCRSALACLSPMCLLEMGNESESYLGD